MDQQDVLKKLSKHVGPKSGISAEHLVSAIVGEVTPAGMRRLRAHITSLRHDGVPICGHPSSGYYLASNAEEIHQSCLWLRSRALSSLVLVSKLENIAVPDLLGQMQLELQKTG